MSQTLIRARKIGAAKHVGAKGFTLIEMMVVMVLVAILLAVAVPAFLTMGKGSKFDAAIAQVRTTLSLARQWAITHREATYVVFPTKNSLRGGTSVDQKEHIHTILRGYNVYTESDGYLREWSFLPPGLAFADKSESSYSEIETDRSIFSYTGKHFDRNYVQVGFPFKNSGKKNLAYIGFNPDGTTMNGPERSEIHLSEAIISADETSGNVDVVFPEPEDTPLFGIEVSPLTGGVRIKDYRE